jgi:hypothetical protein
MNGAEPHLDETAALYALGALDAIVARGSWAKLSARLRSWLRRSLSPGRRPHWNRDWQASCGHHRLCHRWSPSPPRWWWDSFRLHIGGNRTARCAQ